MTDRIRQLVVTLDADYRDDDVVRIVDSIAMIKGVEHVSTKVATVADQCAVTIAKLELRRQVLAKIEEVLHV